ncbi:MAG: aminotransferase class V-fold PLP-dependent enzyme [Alphaproteobacteria bacterium]|nr:aminotransferase class V-fold PLP-dependent enzyme [Alphaproteobacteria bacterium]
MPPIYLDHHATTPCDPSVVQAMLPWFTERAGNASSRGHRFGVAAREATERGRAAVAARVGCSPKEVVFTSGATEADNLAVLGVARAARSRGKRHVITVATEHRAVLDPVLALTREGFEATVLPVDGRGGLDPDDLRRELRPDTALVSAMLVNNEIGVVHPIAALGAICREASVPLHCDAAQAGSLPLPWASVDLLSLSAHKVYGPQGVGALCVRRRPRIEIQPLVHGGGHERGLRSGTLPVPLIVGFGHALGLLSADEGRRLAALRDRLWRGLSERIEGVSLNGPALEDRAPQNLHVSFEGIEAEALLMSVRDELALSTGSACSSETLEPSHVLRALDLPRDRAHASVRFGLGRFNDEAQIDRAVALLADRVATLRHLTVG